MTRAYYTLIGAMTFFVLACALLAGHTLIAAFAGAVLIGGIVNLAHWPN